MRLDKFLADCGAGTRKEVRQLIKSGIVSVNAKTVRDASVHIDENSAEVYIGDKRAEYNKYIYLMLNKPAGYVSANDDKRHPPVTDLVPDEYAHYDLFCVGRLDLDTVGLLILTNDGPLAHILTSPKHHAEKTYFVKTDLPLDESMIDEFKSGVVIDGGYKCKSAALELLPDLCEAKITVTEGKFHQIKRMFQAYGRTVVYLKRLSMGGVCLDKVLGEGEMRLLSEDEIALLRNPGEKQ